MRSSLAALVVVVGGCAYTDLGRPLAIHVDEVSEDDAANIEEAARCWNLKFGTHLQIGGEADQVIEAFYDNQTCLTAVAQFQPGTPGRLAICPHRYWNTVLAQQGLHTYLFAREFRVFSHELGHALNIIGHPSVAIAVMREGGDEGREFFHRVDEEMFREFNPDWNIVSPCTSITRSHRAFTEIGRCFCAGVDELDLDRPIAVQPDPNFDPARVAKIADAATCWNVRYGLQLAVRTPAPDDQILAIESETDVPMSAIALAFGSSWSSSTGRTQVFLPIDDMTFQKAHPTAHVVCQNVASVDPLFGGPCSCLD
jgi:hypothetical protein